MHIISGDCVRPRRFQKAPFCRRSVGAGGGAAESPPLIAGIIVISTPFAGMVSHVVGLVVVGRLSNCRPNDVLRLIGLPLLWE
jgi:hypothetical protein